MEGIARHAALKLGQPHRRASVNRQSTAAWGAIRRTDTYGELVKRLPRDYAAYLAFSGTAMCDEKMRADAEAFFGQRTSRAPGGPRILAQALEQLELCVAVKQRQQPSVAAFLKKQ